LIFLNFLYKVYAHLYSLSGTTHLLLLEILNSNANVKYFSRHFQYQIIHSCFSRTALHWACKERYLNITILLLKNDANKNLRSEIGEIPASVCSNQQILYLLSRMISSESCIIRHYVQLHPCTLHQIFYILLQTLQKLEIICMIKADLSHHFKIVWYKLMQFLQLFNSYLHWI